MSEDIRNQNIKNFSIGCQSIGGELDEGMAVWDYDQMVKEFRKAALSFGGSNSIRTFCRRYLGMKNDSFARARKWMKDEAIMPPEAVVNVLRALKKFRKEEGPAPVTSVVSENRANTTPGSQRDRIARKLIDVTITLFNAQVGVIGEANIRPNDVFDGDRMQITSALEKICERFGIAVTFPPSPNPHNKQNEPITRQDLNEIGLSRKEFNAKS